MHWYEDDKIIITSLSFFFLETRLIAFLKPLSTIYFKFVLSHNHVL